MRSWKLCHLPSIFEIIQREWKKKLNPNTFKPADPHPSANPNEPSSAPPANAAAIAAQAGASARSLRELWLKKLECEAVLSLLRKTETLRRAPSGFDALIRPADGGPCRLGSAVVVLAEALDIMFSDDVAQVQAFDRIMEQLMTRKQRAEEMLWATLSDVLYRHGDRNRGGEGEERRRRERLERRARAAAEAAARGDAAGMSTIAEIDSEDDDEDGSGSYTANTRDSFEDDASTVRSERTGNSSSLGNNINSTSSGNIAALNCKRMVGRAVLESEIDLEGDELRCLEEPMAAAAFGQPNSGPRYRVGRNGGHSHLPASYSYPEQALPRYTDPVLALRILVECLTRLKRLDDVQRHLGEGIDREIRAVAEREQARTFARLERRRGRVGAASEDGDESGNELKEFRVHLNNLLRALGGVMTRFLHLTQILRHKIVSFSQVDGDHFLCHFIALTR